MPCASQFAFAPEGMYLAGVKTATGDIQAAKRLNDQPIERMLCGKNYRLGRSEPFRS